MDCRSNHLKSVVFEFHRYKTMGDETFEQIKKADIHWMYGEENNSISQIAKDLVGNMLSRWTHFMTEDGEKPWRNRDMEFIAPYPAKKSMKEAWEEGWESLFNALDSINMENFDTDVNIGNRSHTIIEAINRQLAHYASHVG
ncbi:MAG: DUF1572 family protein [Bacteroidota bacterium]